MIRILVSLIILGTLTSCGSGEEVPLKSTLPSSAAVFIDSSTRSCRALFEDATPAEDPDIQAKYFRVKNVKLRWTEEGTTFVLAYIRITIESEGLQDKKLAVTLPDDEIPYLTCIPGGSGTCGGGTTFSGTLTKAQGDVTFTCPLTVGGVSIPDGASNFQAAGTVEFVGYSVNGNGDESPVRLTDYFTVEFR